MSNPQITMRMSETSYNFYLDFMKYNPNFSWQRLFRHIINSVQELDDKQRQELVQRLASVNDPLYHYDRRISPREANKIVPESSTKVKIDLGLLIT